MLRRATLLLCLLPGAVLAQTTTAGTTTVTVSTQSLADLANRADCASSTTTAIWTISSSVTPVITAGDKYRLAAVAQTTGCSTNGGTTAAPAGILDVTATGANQVVTGVLLGSMATAAGVTDCAGAADVPVSLCVYYLPAGATTNWSLASQDLNFVFQLAVPPPPQISKSTPGNAQLTVAVAAGTTDTSHQATTGVTYNITCTGSAGGSVSTGGPGNAGNIVCGGLTNSVAYTVTATGTSQAGNVGPASPAFGPDASTTPLPFLDFWSVYKGDGGVENGGCSTAGAGALSPVLALLGLLAVRRRRP